MKIFISQELMHIRQELKKRGYEIIDKPENQMYDVIICNLKNGGLISPNINSSIEREGTLIIDSGSKSIEEIECILNNRSCSTLL
ncbi:hypothetical protein HBE96_04925 [Clostridium sp. P21]|uniref:YkuS family protein n=1 Tax=Clostridium muellerianum TaxID=2716538 RepID=A0A7Y0EEH4_9CLOT|nr:YkuS family protein [Clostridium muellerianum]NMM62044.1 hypothetical protein [Clostridium muellerianum]